MKEKIVGYMKKLWALMNNPKYEKAIVIVAPCLAVLIAASILMPGINAVASQVRRAEPSPAVAASPASPESSALIASPDSGTPGTPQPSPSAEPVREEIKTFLRASSTEKDLYVTVYDEAGKPVTGERFTLTVGYPGGQNYNFDTETDGSCYLVRLDAGEYRVSMNEHAGYTAAAPITCTVKGQLVYEQIENIDEYLDVRDVADIPENEVKTPDDYAAPNVTVPEEVGTPDDPYADGGIVTEQYPVLDANGNQTYTYTYDVGENGYLLYRDTGEESNVEPIDEDGDGQIDYGLYFFIPQTPEEGTESDITANGYYKSEILFNWDNTPVETYAIYAEPIMGTTTRNVGWREINGNMYYYDNDGNPVKGLKKIDGKIYYFDQFGIRARSVGIDVSYYDGDINWRAVKAQGIDFAIIRVGGRTWRDGTLYDDHRTVEYFTEAKAAGIKVGAYFYSTAINTREAVEEASVALKTLGGVGLDFPVFFDTEYSGIYPEGRADNLDRTLRSEIIRAFCETITNSSDYSAGVYTGEYFMKNSLDYSSISQYTIWLASYTSNNNLPNFSGRYDIWQFTDRGVIDGISEYVDMNVIF